MSSTPAAPSVPRTFNEEVALYARKHSALMWKYRTLPNNRPRAFLLPDHNLALRCKGVPKGAVYLAEALLLLKEDIQPSTLAQLAKAVKVLCEAEAKLVEAEYEIMNVEGVERTDEYREYYERWLERLETYKK